MLLRLSILLVLVFVPRVATCFVWNTNHRSEGRYLDCNSHRNLKRRRTTRNTHHVLSSDYMENDIVSVLQPTRKEDEGTEPRPPRLCVVRPDNTVLPLCQHEDDVETDLFLDPRCEGDKYWIDPNSIGNEQIVGTYGEGWYGQRPVPSLGGGPGYGADADEIWSLDESTLTQIQNDGVELPILDVGIAHGEKARGGALF